MVGWLYLLFAILLLCWRLFWVWFVVGYGGAVPLDCWCFAIKGFVVLIAMLACYG